MKMKQVRAINEAEFASEVLHSHQPALVGFVASWSEACGRFEPVLDQVAAACDGSAGVFKVNVDDNPDLGTQYAIQSVPTLICFINGSVRMKIVGTVSAKAVLAKLQVFAQQQISPSENG
jgi:thioredoxin-like negative regulator of GroEL